MGELPRSRVALIALISLLTICFQLLLTKVLAFVFWNHLVYLAISLALLGYGAASTALAVRRDSDWKENSDTFLSKNLAAFSAAAVVGLALLRFFDLDALDSLATAASGRPDAVLLLLAAYSIFVLPFFFAGNVVVGLFVFHPGHANRLYFADLVGAAVGCVVFLPLIRWSGALGGALLCAAAALLWSAWIEHRQPRRAWSRVWVYGLSTLALLVVYPFRDDVFALKVDRAKVLSVALRENPSSKVEHTAWDVVTRVDVVGGDGDGMGIGWSKVRGNDKLVTFDGDAVSHIPERSRSFPSDEQVAHFQKNSHYIRLVPGAVGGDHLIIGVGGGPDISTSLLMQARSVTAVEINGALIRALKGKFSEFGGRIALRENVRLVHSEGRSYLRREDRKFDFIHMSGTDTFTALSTGAYALAENFLYTKEAIREYYDHLSDDGRLLILRWFFSGHPRESLRLFSTMLEALRDAGVEEPLQHVFVARAIWSPEFSPGLTVLSKRPIDAAAARAMLEDVKGHSSLRPVYAPLPPRTWDESFIPEARIYAQLATAFALGREKEFYEAYPFDVEPVDDDRPFFFNYYKLSRLFESGASVARSTGPIHGYWGYFVFGLVLLYAGFAVLLFIWLPLWRFRKDGLRGRGNLRAAGYFCALGLGFIMLEISLMQKLALFLGHPMYSIATVLASLLLFAGLGSHLAGRWRERARTGILVAFVGAAATSLIFLAGGNALLDALLGLDLWLRIASASVIVAPFGLFLGFFFPLGLTIIERRDPRFVPWAWGINSGFTVIGSVLAIIIAMAVGFAAVVTLVVAIYGAGVLAMLSYERDVETST